MARLVRPTPAFATVPLEITTIDPAQVFGRIHLARYLDSLGVGKTPSRFSDPRVRRPETARFAVLYLGRTLKTCFVEALLRDRRNGAVGDYPLEESEFHERVYAEIQVVRPLHLVDLRDDGRIRMGVPSDAVNASDQRTGRLWSVALHDHPQQPDGIAYPSRLNDRTNLAIYDRALAKLSVTGTYPLAAAPGLASVLDDCRVAII